MCALHAFVILRHEPPAEGGGRALHWDLMLDRGDRLQTWALDREPRLGETISARQLPDHRRAYLQYEGPLSGGRGQVACWDRGVFRWTEQGEDRVQVQLLGKRLQGTVLLCRDSGDSQRWTARFTPA